MIRQVCGSVMQRSATTSWAVKALEYLLAVGGRVENLGCPKAVAVSDNLWVK